MKDLARAGTLAGILAALTLGAIDLGFTLAADGSAGAPWYGFLLALPFYWGVLLPAG